MKNQYVGDVSDYRKYGLLRCISRASDLKILVAWMLTKADGSTHGQMRDYLERSGKWSGHDPELFQALRHLVDQNVERSVGLIETANLLPKTEFFSELVPDAAADRDEWFARLLTQSTDCDLVFLDPDNGIEIKSKPYGRSESSKYVFYQELAALWRLGKSLLIYQHFIREKREVFIKRITEKLSELTPDSRLAVFTTSHVVFFLLLQPRHEPHLRSIMSEVNQSWSGVIKMLSMSDSTKAH